MMGVIFLKKMLIFNTFYTILSLVVSLFVIYWFCFSFEDYSHQLSYWLTFSVILPLSIYGSVCSITVLTFQNDYIIIKKRCGLAQQTIFYYAELSIDLLTINLPSSQPNLYAIHFQKDNDFRVVSDKRHYKKLVTYLKKNSHISGL